MAMATLSSVNTTPLLIPTSGETHGDTSLPRSSADSGGSPQARPALRTSKSLMARLRDATSSVFAQTIITAPSTNWTHANKASNGKSNALADPEAEVHDNEEVVAPASLAGNASVNATAGSLHAQDKLQVSPANPTKVQAKSPAPAPPQLTRSTATYFKGVAESADGVLSAVEASSDLINDGTKLTTDIGNTVINVGTGNVVGGIMSVGSALFDGVKGIRDAVQVIKDSKNTVDTFNKAVKEEGDKRAKANEKTTGDASSVASNQTPIVEDPTTIDITAVLGDNLPDNTEDIRFSMLEEIARKRVPNVTDRDAYEAMSRIALVYSRAGDDVRGRLAQKLTKEMRKVLDDTMSSSGSTAPAEAGDGDGVDILRSMVEMSVEQYKLTTDSIRSACYEMLTTKDILANRDRHAYLRDLLLTEFDGKTPQEALRIATFVSMNRPSADAAGTGGAAKSAVDAKLSDITQIFDAYHTVDSLLARLPQKPNSSSKTVTESALVSSLKRAGQISEAMTLDAESNAAEPAKSAEGLDRIKWMSAKLAALRLADGKPLLKVSAELIDNLGITAKDISDRATGSNNRLAASAALSLMSLATNGHVLCLPDAAKFESGIQSGRSVGEVLEYRTMMASTAVIDSARTIMKGKTADLTSPKIADVKETPAVTLKDIKVPQVTISQHI